MKLSDCYAKFGAARLSLFSFHTLGGFFCFAFIIIIIIIIFFKFIFFILLFSAAPVPLPRHSDSGGRRFSLRGSGMCSRARGDPRPAPQPQGPSAARRGLPAGFAPGDQQRKYINRITHRARKGRTKNRPGKGTYRSGENKLTIYNCLHTSRGDGGSHLLPPLHWLESCL